MRDQDLAAKAEEERKKDINKLFMKNAFAERQEYKKKELEKEKQLDEDIKKYNEMIKQREKDIAQKKMIYNYKKIKFSINFVMKKLKEKLNKIIGIM